MAPSPAPEDRSRKLGRIVAAALSEQGISQRDTAAQTGIPMTTLRRRLTGNSPFLMSELALLAELLGVTVTSLVAQAEDVAA